MFVLWCIKIWLSVSRPINIYYYYYYSDNLMQTSLHDLKWNQSIDFWEFFSPKMVFLYVSRFNPGSSGRKNRESDRSGGRPLSWEQLGCSEIVLRPRSSLSHTDSHLRHFLVSRGDTSKLTAAVVFARTLFALSLSIALSP